MKPTSQHPSDAFAQFVRVVGSSVSPETGAVLLSVEGLVDAGADAEGTLGAETYGVLGLVCRPLPPDEVGGVPRHVEGVSLRTADALVPVALRDVRLNQAYPNPKPGDIVLVGYGSNFVKMAVDGGIYLGVTTDGTPNGQLVQLQHRGDGVAYVAPWGKLTFDAGGLHVLHHSGARPDLGGIGGLPAPLSALGNYVTLAAALIKLQCSALTVGPDTAVPDNAVKATPLEALLGLISAAAFATAAAETVAATAFTALAANPIVSPTPHDAAVHTAAAAAATNAAAQFTALVAAITAALPPVSPTSVRSQSLSVT